MSKQLIVLCYEQHSVSTCSHTSITEKMRGSVRTIFIGYTETHILTSIFIMYTLFCFHPPLCSAKDTLTSTNSINDQLSETLISAGQIFELGFFTPDGRSDRRRYVGIWYYRSNPRTVVWVFNRDNPLENKGVFRIAADGNLVVFDENNISKWSTRHTLEGLDCSKGMLKLLDSGNLVLSREEDTGSLKVCWQSFDNPTDTFLPGMKMDKKLRLISWTSNDEPASGNFSFEADQDRENQYIIIENKTIPHWKSGLSGMFINDNILDTVSLLLSNVTRANFTHQAFFPNNRSITFSNFNFNNNTRLVMNFSGEVQYFAQDNLSALWRLIWWEPSNKCNVFKACGNFAICNSKNRLLCKCLPGFVPMSPNEWNSGDFSEGCTRKVQLCTEDGKDRNFLTLEIMKLGKPDKNFEANSEKECKEDCLRDCNCQAYSIETKQLRRSTGKAICWIWSENLNNIQENKTDGGREIHLRQNDGEVGSTKKDDGGFNGRKIQGTLIAAVAIASLTVLACIIAYIYMQQKKAKRREDRQSALALHLYDSQRHVKDLIDSVQFKEEDKKGIDIPFFDFGSILAATDNFSEANKLGKGGFGPVYKGKFSGGQDIAVKRLSCVSGQGLEEFRNEVVLIARLQHRNLVRLLGYCIEGGEKILLYEYMPNKSLDFFIFDRTLSVLLDWEIRFNIILGIARGLLYLHQDSRLRIIHRDLKTSNILLDHEMNAKISDFGLAKIFEGKQTEGTTSRVVGTYGYMSPEYALEGLFSVKSDVFSFGVVVLEIISGKKNTGFYNSEEALSLLGYAWRLWQQGKGLDLVDQKLRASLKKNEILKCINVGLLCVQEDPHDRPTISDVIIMLGSETVTLPTPKRSAFVVRRGLSSSASSSGIKPETNIEITATLEGR